MTIEKTIDKTIQKITELCGEWDATKPECRTYGQALQLECSLSIFKYLCKDFDDLPYFRRKLEEATECVDSKE